MIEMIPVFCYIFAGIIYTEFNCYAAKMMYGMEAGYIGRLFIFLLWPLLLLGAILMLIFEKRE